jgi:hypothetical protein
MAHEQKSFFGQFLKNKVPMLLKRPPTFFLQEACILAPRLVQGLHMMSLVKAVPKGIRDKECKRFVLRERPSVPYMPEKDPVQEMVSALKSDQSLKTTIREDAELCFPIWHCGTREAFLMHMSSALDAIKKRGTFKAYKEACEAYVEQCKVAKHAKAALALLTAPTSKGKKEYKKASVKKIPEKEKASQKTKESVALANPSALELCKEYQTVYKKASFAKETAKNKRKAAATESLWMPSTR